MVRNSRDIVVVVFVVVIVDDTFFFCICHYTLVNGLKIEVSAVATIL